MKITINTTAKDVEMVNFILSQSFDSAANNRTWCEQNYITPKDLVRIEKFRKSLLKSLLNPSNG